MSTQLAAVAPGRTFPNGVSVVHAGFEKFTRPLPAKTFPPLLVMALTTPPLNRPNSAEMPDVRTCVSSIASLDEQVLRLGKEVVVDVDAVDHEHVVERERVR